MLWKLSCTLSLALVASIKASPFKKNLARTTNSKNAKRVSSLLGAAKTIRRLDEDEEEEIDISGYTIVFQKCQFIKSYDADLAQEEDSETVLAVKRFVLFRLCPTETNCKSGYGEYLVDMETYLEVAVEYFGEYQENMCNACQEACQYDDDNGRKLRFLESDCDTCMDECDKIENMEDNGYIDASNYIECQQIYESDDDANDVAYYAGAMCASSGEKIKIGVFLDEECSQLDTSKSVEDYLEYKLSHGLMKNIYSSSGVSCTEYNWDAENEDDAAADDDEEEEIATTEMCQELYEAAAKCESPYNFADGYASYEGYENQASQESLVCDYIDTLSSGRYDQTGDIILKGRNTGVSGGVKATGGQKFSLFVLVVGTCGLASYAANIHTQLTKKGTTDLSEQGGAMA